MPDEANQLYEVRHVIYFLVCQARNLTRIHHKNLVSLIGYCKDCEYLALVYEHMSEGNLQDKLRGLLFPLFV
jgi:serine/threonine protein kinase